MFEAITTILKSASKLVFVLLTIAVIVALFVGRVDSQQFVGLTTMAFTFYFASKGDASKPYAGK